MYFWILLQIYPCELRLILCSRVTYEFDRKFYLISSSTTSVQHPPGWCDGSHISPERPPHTSYRWRGDSDESIQCMGMIRRPWWSEASGQIWPGCRVNTPTLFRRTSWDLNDHRESGPRFNVSSKGQFLFWYSVPITTLGWAPPAGLTNTSSSSNLVFIGGLPSRYWPAQPCLASVGNRSWNRVLYGCYKLYR